MNILLITNTFPFIKKGNAEASFLRVLVPYLFIHFNNIFLVPTVNNNKKNKYYRKILLIGGNNILKFNIIIFIKLYIYNFSILKLDFKNINFNIHYFYNIYRLNYVYIKSLIFFCFIDQKIKSGIISHNKLLIYSFWFDDYFLGLIFLKNKYNLKLVVSAHGYDLYEFRNKGNRIPFREYALSHVNMVFPDSYAGVDYLKMKYPKLINNKVNTFLPSISKKPICISFSNDGLIRFLTISRTHPVKRLDHLLNILKCLEFDYHEICIEWTHIGSGEEYDALCNLLKNLCFTRFKINFKSTFTDLEIKNFYYNEPIDFFLNVSSSEGTSLALIEAISYGVPVICTKVGGNIFVAEQCGYLLEVDYNHHDLYKIIRPIIHNKKDHILLSQKCITTWAKYFNPSINSNKFLTQILY